jgi:hypothetical protein
MKRLISHLDFHFEDGCYVLDLPIRYDSPRYFQTVTVPAGFPSDGASGPATDIVSISWFVHDMLCDTGRFDNGAICTRMMAANILYDILKAEGRTVRCWTWWLATGPWMTLWRGNKLPAP